MGKALAIGLALLTGVSVDAIRAETESALRDEVLKLNQITGTTAIDGKLRELVGDKDKTKELVKAAVQLAKVEEDDDQPLSFNAALLLGKAASLLEDVESGKLFFRIGAKRAMELQSSYKLIQVYDGLIDLYYVTDNYEEAVKVCQEFLEIREPRLNNVKPFVMERLIQAKAKQGKVDEALRLSEGLAEADTGGWYFLKLKGWVLREAGKYQESAEIYQDVISRLRTADLKDAEKDLYTRQVRYLLSGLYVDLNKIEKAAEQLEVLLKNDPDNPTYYNDLGFIWADHDMKLDESEKLIRKALELDEKQREELGLTGDDAKPNPAYLDSLGWVLYKKGEYEEAAKYLEQAVEQEDGRHIEIMDHLADAYLKLGRTEEAVKTWEKALELDDVSHRDKERRERVREKLSKNRPTID